MDMALTLLASDGLCVFYPASACSLASVRASERARRMAETKVVWGGRQNVAL